MLNGESNIVASVPHQGFPCQAEPGWAWNYRRKGSWRFRVAVGASMEQTERRKVARVHPTLERITMRRRSLLVALAAGVLTLGVTLPASADTTAPTTATITITGGSLAITAPANAGNLGSRTNTVLGGTISGPLGQVQVEDGRSAAAGSGWVVSVISTAFTPPSGPAIAASAVGYTVGTITKVGTATYTANDPPNLTGVAPAITATGITGDNSATWNPMINVSVPGGMAANVYSATITHSVV
jgi:hypothetical protein